MSFTEHDKPRPFDNCSGVVLNIGIVGAGIAGLTAAAMLSQIGHHVDVYERSSFANEVGAAINIGPNAAPVLNALGFDYQKANSQQAQEGVQFNAQTLQETYRGDYSHFEDRFKAPWLFVHRVDLHNELKRLALGKPGQSGGARLHLATPIVNVDCDNGVMLLEDGTKVSKDIIIGADGVHSVVAQCVLGSKLPATSVGECAFRFLIPTTKLLENPITRHLFEESKSTIHIATASDRRLVWYPCRNGKLQNFVGMHPTKEDSDEPEDWLAGGSTNDLVETFSTFHPTLVEICRNAEDVKRWNLIYRPPLKSWTKGKTILIGDAAHPMLPHQGQGGNQAIEDAGALGALLSNIPSYNSIPQRLKLVQDIRWNRAAAMQIFSNAAQDRSHQVEEEVRAYYTGPIPRNPEEFHAWNFDYDILDVCSKAKEKLLAL